MTKRFLLLALCGFVALLAVIVVRTASLPSRRISAQPAPARNIDVSAAAAHLAKGLSFPTVSRAADQPPPAAALLALHAHLAATYPLVHARLERETVSGYSLLYRWPGRDVSREPILLMAHQDVVPVDAGDWERPPFAGEIVDGTLWGRGALDDKSALYAILEAVELLIAENFEPARTIYLFFGHDEELGGPNGAVPASKLLEARGIDLAWVIDEGGFIVDGFGGQIDDAVALVGIAEKGSVTYTLSIDESGGHSSVPPRHSAIGVMAEALTRLEANPMPGSIDDPTEEFLLAIAPELPIPARAVLANLWLFRPLVEAGMASDPRMDAMQRTTTAVTRIAGGVKSNVLPSHVEATVNFRIRSGDSAEGIREHIRRVIDDERIQITRSSWYREASPISATDSEAFAFLSQTIAEIFPGVPVVPYTVPGGTDARNFYRVTANVFRFNPFRFDAGATSLVHGTNERIEVAGLADAIRFYARLIERSGER